MEDGHCINIVTVGNSHTVKGGITSVIDQILAYDWTQQNVNMSFVATFDGGNAIHKIIYFLNAYLSLRKLCENRAIDIMHVHMSHAGSFTRKYYIYKLCKKCGIPIILHLHSSSFVEFYNESTASKKKKIQQLLSGCDCVVALGEEWEQRIKIISPDANVCILNNTIAIPSYCVSEEEHPVKILYLGVLVKRKGVIDLLKAIKTIKDEGFLDTHDAAFNIGGTGECEDELKRYSKDNGLDKYINFLGWVSGKDKSEQLETNHVLVLPSYGEGLPIAILEAISYGMPVVATDVGSVAEAVRDNENGFLYEAGNIDALSRSLKTIIENDQLRIEFGKKSRILAEEVFSDKNYFDKLGSLYRIYSK